jgi:hypothetical protein
MESFEDFLKEVHAEVFPQLLDDDLSDHFDDWLGSLDGEEYIRWGDLYGQKMHLAGSQETIAELDQTVDEITLPEDNFDKEKDVIDAD